MVGAVEDANFSVPSLSLEGLASEFQARVPCADSVAWSVNIQVRFLERASIKPVRARHTHTSDAPRQYRPANGNPAHRIGLLQFSSPRMMLA